MRIAGKTTNRGRWESDIGLKFISLNKNIANLPVLLGEMPCVADYHHRKGKHVLLNSNHFQAAKSALEVFINISQRLS